jgi:protein translocase SecG subunit
MFSFLEISRLLSSLLLIGIVLIHAPKGQGLTQMTSSIRSLNNKIGQKALNILTWIIALSFVVINGLSVYFFG